MKYFLIFGIIGILAYIVLLLTGSLGGSVSPEGVSFQDIPDDSVQPQMITPVTPQPLLAENELLVNGKDGNQIKITNPATKTVGTNVGLGMYQFTGSAQEIKKPYSLLFNANNGSFAISLDEAPYKTAHEQMSYDLLDLLGITREQACELSVYVGVTAAQDASLSGLNLGLIFCN